MLLTHWKQKNIKRPTGSKRKIKTINQIKLQKLRHDFILECSAENYSLSGHLVLIN